MVTQTALPLPSVAVRGDVQKTFIDVKVLSGFTDSGHIEILLGDYLSRLNDTDKALALSEIDATRAFVATLPPFQPTQVVKRSISGTHVDGIRADPLFQQNFGQRPHQFAYVDLTQLVALQPWIETRSDQISTDETELLHFALPHNWEVPAEVTFIQPNGPIQILTSNPALNSIALEFDKTKGTVSLGAPKHINLVQVVHYNGRHYLRNGYHRVADALAVGINEFPALVVEAMGNPMEFMLTAYGAFNGLYMSSLLRPPLVTDFHTQAAVASKVRERRYAVIVNLDVKQLNIGI